jgi:hypothetical protein
MGEVVSMLKAHKEVVEQLPKCEIRRQQLFTSDDKSVRQVVVAKRGSEQKVRIVKIGSEQHGGRLPSRCFVGRSGRVELLFYCMPGSSNGLIGDQNLYGFVLHDVDFCEVVSYPPDLPVWIDQCIDSVGKCHYVFLFTEQNWNTVVVRESGDAVL